MNVYGANRADNPFFSGFNGVADLQERAKKVDEDIAAAKEKYGADLPAGNYDSFIVLEKGETKVSLEFVSQNGNTYDYKVNRCDTAEFSAVKTEGLSGAKGGLTDRDIFTIFTGREPMKTKGTPFEGKNAAGSEEWFDEDGNFIYKDDKELIAHYKSFYELTVFSGIPMDKQSPKDVADFFGNVGRRIDEAYAAGKCTEEQKAQLDKLLTDTALEFSERAQKRQAMFKICREEYNLPIAQRMALIESRKATPAEERMAEMKAKINDYVNKYFKVEPETLLNMVNQIRYGTLSLLRKN